MSDPASTPYSPYYRTSWAIIIGIDTYAHLRPLYNAVRDAHDVASMLMNYHSFPASQVILLTDNMATLDNILALFDTVINPSTVDPDDRILIYFAGHGYTRTAQDGSKEGYLAPYDASPKQWRTLLPMPDLIKQARFLPAKHILFVMDACYSGLSLRTSHAIPPVMDHFLTRRSVQVITAGREDERVSDGRDLSGNSAFTSLFLDGLAGNAVTASSLMTASDLMKYISHHVALRHDVQQSPQYGWVEGNGDFVFALPQGLYLPLRLEVTLRQGTAPARLLAVNELTDIASGDEPDLAALAEQRLLEVAEYDPDPRVTHTALRLLGIDVPAPPPTVKPPRASDAPRRQTARMRRRVTTALAVGGLTICLAVVVLSLVFAVARVPINDAPDKVATAPIDLASKQARDETDVPPLPTSTAPPPAAPGPTASLVPADEAEVTPTIETPSVERTIVFADDFARGDELWESMPEDQRVRRVIADGEMVFSVLTGNSLWFTRPRSLSISNGTIQTTISPDGETTDGYFGILFRQVDPDNYYYYRMSLTGEAVLLIQLAGSVQELASTTVEDATVNQKAPRQMRVHLAGPRITLSLNDQVIAEVIDNRFQSGRVGLIVQSSTTAPISVLFSDFIIFED